MNQSMTHTRDERPRNLRVLVAKSVTDLARGLSHDLNGVKQCEGQHLISIEILAASSIGELDCGTQRIDNVTQTDLIIRLRTASPPRW
jgi:hypothetical protein